jgi:hypothetical protein
MATTMTAKTLDSYQYSMQLITKSQSFKLNASRKNQKPKTKTYSDMLCYIIRYVQFVLRSLC